MNYDLAWAAGLFEGEGCFTLNKGSTGRVTPRASVTSTDLDVLERFQQTIGFGLLRAKRHKDMPSRYKDKWEWAASGHELVQALMAMLWPGLSKRRRERAVEVLRIFRGQGGVFRVKKVSYAGGR
jgi:hypothetical protein